MFFFHRIGRTREAVRRLLVVAVLGAGVLAGSAAAATYERFLPAGSYSYGTSASSSYGSSWINANSHTTTAVDRTITLIDNVSYSWHGTHRSTAPDVWASWNSSTVKKGYCVLHTSGTVACTVFDY